MKTAERLDRIEATLEKLSDANAATQANLERLATVTATIAESVAAHDGQIEKLVAVAEIQQQRWEQLQREWQAYLTTIHPRQ
jgi:ABC-type transporter Mla subunit MlaD